MPKAKSTDPLVEQAVQNAFEIVDKQLKIQEGIIEESLQLEDAEIFFEDHSPGGEAFCKKYLPYVDFGTDRSKVDILLECLGIYLSLDPQQSKQYKGRVEQVSHYYMKLTVRKFKSKDDPKFIFPNALRIKALVEFRERNERLLEQTGQEKLMRLLLLQAACKSVELDKSCSGISWTIQN